MACELSMQCDLVYRFLKSALPEDIIDVDLKVHTFKESTHLKRITSPKHPNVSHGEQTYIHTPP